MAEPAAPEDDPVDPWAQLEAEANALLEQLPADDLETGQKALIDKLRKQLDGRAKREREAYDRGRQEALAELKAQAEREQALDRLSVPRALRQLFDGIDLGDQGATAAKLAELRDGGVTWGGQQAAPTAGQPHTGQPPAPQAAAPDPALLTGLFQQAQAAGVPGQAGDVLSRVAQGGASAIRDAGDAASFEQALNQQVGALGAQRRAGVIG